MNQDGDMDGLQVQVQLVKVRSRSAGGPSGLSSIPAALYFNCPPPPLPSPSPRRSYISTSYLGHPRFIQQTTSIASTV